MKGLIHGVLLLSLLVTIIVIVRIRRLSGLISQRSFDDPILSAPALLRLDLGMRFRVLEESIMRRVVVRIKVIDRGLFLVFLI